jgi:hypothetical protein
MSLLADVLRTDTVVIAKVHGASATGVELDVERTIKGTARVGALLVTTPTMPAAAPYAAGTRLVAFIDAHGVWHTAALATGGTLETGVLHLEGLPVCCDAIVVTPSIATLTQVESAIRGTPLAWTFRGNLELPSATGPARSTIDIEAITPSNAVRGLPPMVGFAAPQVSVGFSIDGAVMISLNATAARAVSPMRIVGEATAKNPDGSIAVTFRVTEPPGMTEADFRKFAGSASLTRPYYTADVILADGTHMTLQLGKDMGRIGVLTTSAGTFPLTGLVMAPSRNLSSAAGTIELDPRRPGLAVQRTGAVGELVQELLVGPIACRFVSASATRGCTVSHVVTKFSPP